MAMTRVEACRRLVVALDTSERERILALARTLQPYVGMFKLGLEAFTAHGPALVEEVRSLGMPVFLDLKLHDIPNTVEKAAANCARLGVAMLTTHAGGGSEMLAAAVAGAQAGAPGRAAAPVVLAVTVLTSLDDRALGELAMPGATGDRVRAWAAVAARAGCGGVVCSPHEVAALRAAHGPDFVLLVPGIRPAGEAAGDQRRVATPRQAVDAGASLIVVGRPITGAADPAAAAAAILAELMAP